MNAIYAPCGATPGICPGPPVGAPITVSWLTVAIGGTVLAALIAVGVLTYVVRRRRKPLNPSR